MDKGILYLAIGEQHYTEAVASAESVRRFCDLPIAIVTDLAASGGSFDFVFSAGVENPHIEKVKAIINAPFERVLYLDTDTRVIGKFYVLFDLLDKFDIAAVADDYIDRHGAPPALPVFNSGMLAYDADATRAMFGLWLGKVSGATRGDGDQKFLRTALWEHPVKLATVSRNYNFRCDYPWQTWGSVAILHGRRHIDAAAEHINDSLHLRLWRPNDEQIEVLR